ncbi:MAG: AAA family ATPase [Patescibacteria group bacterium]
MYLEKLEVQGFKSFAHKNKLIFSGLIDGRKRGLTAIVGPNGSGKSNVADSIRWALGEQSLKTLRGKKSEDVIFSGSDQKNQLSLAEVSLYLNNAEAAKKNLAAPEMIEKESDLDQVISSCPEIVITRRLYRNGESEYLLNNSRVRLADIQMLLAKANFGQKTYSVIGQGMVENFLSTSAAERKDFFDEATGVKQFQIKRDAALNKLENSYENLQQVDMLLTEIKPRLKSLTRQVERLKRRGEIENDLRQNQLNYYSWLWQDINQKLDNFNDRLLENEKLKLERDRRLDKLNEELNKIRATDNFREMEELQPRLKTLANQKNQYLKQLAKLQAELETRLDGQGQFDVSWLNNKRGELTAALENIQAEIRSLTNSGHGEEEAKERASLEIIDGEIARSRELKEKIGRLEEERNYHFKNLSKLEATLEANLEVQGQFDVSWLNNKNEELGSELKKIEEEIAELRTANDPAIKAELEKKSQTVQAKLNRLNEEMEAINQELKRANAGGGRNEEISRLIEEFLDRLDLIDKEDDLNLIKKQIAAAKKDFQTKIAGLISGANADDLEKIQKIQTEIIALTEERQTINNLLNEERLRLASTNERLRLAEDKASQLAREIKDISIKLEKSQIKFDASQIEREKEEINKKISSLDKEIQAWRHDFRPEELQAKRQAALDRIHACRLKSSALEERARLLRDQENQTEKEITAINNKLEKSQIKFDASRIEAEQREIDQKLAGLDQEIKILENKLEELNRAKEKEKGQMFECQKNIQLLQQEINSISEEINRAKVEATRQETKLEDLEANIRNDELNIIDIKNHQITQEINDIERLYKAISAHKSQLESIGGIDPEAEKEYQETKERYDFLSGQTTDLDKAIKSLEEVIYELDLNIKNRFDAEFKIISEKFNDYFKILFNGGTAKIYKVMIEDLEKEEAKNNANANHSPAATGEPAGDATSGLNAAEMAIKKEMDEKLKRIKFLKRHNAVGLAGIEVQATPPGKKIQTVTMLSGGERALTAIALICAIISANPSPFVVLDEVDAALDEANSERLAKILDDLSNKTQFIVITHNRACMRKASILYGVTMESDGVSKLLSVKLDELNLK